MKKCILTLLLVTGFARTIYTSELENEESVYEPIKKNFIYAKFGIGPIPYLYPIVGLVHRMQWNKTGLDYNLNFSAGPMFIFDGFI